MKTLIEHPESTEKSKKQRVQLDLSEGMCQFIDRIVERTHASSRAEVIRRAMSVYGILLDEHDAGKRVEVNDPKTGERERLILP